MSRQVGIVCPVERSFYKGFLCPIKLTSENRRYCVPCCSGEQPELEEFSSREREE